MASPEEKQSAASAYWREHLRLLFVLLVIWFIVSFGLGILLGPALNSIHLFGYPLGFWFAQQGSIYTFLILIFVYVVKMNAMDRKYDVHEE